MTSSATRNATRASSRDRFCWSNGIQRKPNETGAGLEQATLSEESAREKEDGDSSPDKTLSLTASALGDFLPSSSFSFSSSSCSFPFGSSPLLISCFLVSVCGTTDAAAGCCVCLEGNKPLAILVAIPLSLSCQPSMSRGREERELTLYFLLASSTFFSCCLVTERFLKISSCPSFPFPSCTWPSELSVEEHRFSSSSWISSNLTRHRRLSSYSCSPREALQRER
jgi:hypothetical protein